jgi:tRNA threonylcarbamoyladenosine biosynthesis protein TsaB
MPFILALDTTGDAGSLALANGPTLIEEVAITTREGFGQILFGELEQLLARHEVTWSDIACFASAAGPGSFTGVRVGLTAVKGLADASDAKVVGVSNLQALAWFGSGDLRAPWMDARRGEIYGAVYDGQLHLVQDETVTLYDAWAASLPEGAVQIPQGPPLARAIAAISWQRFEAGDAQDAASIDANYVRRSDAEMMWREL